MSKKRIAIAAAGLLIVAGAVAATATAQGHRNGWRGEGRMFGDEGGSGEMRGRFGRALTKDAFDTRTRERFARLDKNGDNVIDAAEIEAAINARMSERHHRGGGSDGIGERMFHRMGAGPDGKLTKDAFRAELTRRFAEADLNNDGRIDDADLPPMMRGRNALSDARMGAFGPARWLRMLGVQAKDGVITREDVLAAGDRQFDRLDRNKDGVLDKADFDALKKDTVAYRVARFIHQFGADKDGRVTREQFMAKAAQRFARMDVNGDGTISRDERPGRGHGPRGWHRGGHGDREGMGGSMMGGDGPRGQGQPAEPPTKN